MPALRGPDGKIVYVDADEVARYTAGGDYTPVSSAAAGAAPVAAQDTGAIGGIRAGLSGILSGATLGLSDLALQNMGSVGDAEQLAAERRAHPTISGLGQFAGAVLPAVISGGAATPSGYLSKLAGEGMAAGAEIGGVRGAAQSLAAAGTEGAIQNAGIYLSDVALGDRDLTAEGVTGALGTGFAFGSGGAVAAHGISAGTIAARRMFARYAEGGTEAASRAAQEWTSKAQTSLEGFDQAAELAEAKLSSARAAREQAEAAHAQAVSGVAEARAIPTELDAAMRPPAANAMPPEQAARVFGGEGIEMAPGAQAELAASVAEYRAARQAFDEVHARVDPDLDAALRGLQAPEIEFTGAVPVGEFGAPGARGFKSQEELARLASGTDASAVAPALEQPGTRVLRGGVKGTPVEPPAVDVPAYEKIKAHENAADGPLEQTVPARSIADRGYYEPPIKPGRPEMKLEEADPVRMANARKAIAEGQREAIYLNVTPTGKITVTGGRHRLAAAIEADAPIKVKWSTGLEPAEHDAFRAGTAKEAAPATDTLTGLLRGTQEKLGAGKSIGEISGAPERGIKIDSEMVSLGSGNSKRGAAAKKAAAASVERMREIHSAVASNLPDELQATWEAEGYKFMREEAPRIRGEKDPINAASRLSEAFSEKYGSASETARGYEGDRYHRRAEIEAEHAESWADEQERKHYAAAMRDEKVHQEAADADELLSLLHGTKSKLGEGAKLSDIGAPVRAAYAKNKAALRAEAALHFRAKAMAARDLAEPWNAGIPFGKSGTYATSPMAAAEREAQAMAAEERAAQSGHPLDVKQLEMAHDAAVERAATATEPAERAAATAEAQAIEKQITAVGARPGAVEDVAAMAEVVTRVEKAAAKLTESLGDAAPAAAKEHAAAFRAAEDAADRKTAARIARAADDHAAEPAAYIPRGQRINDAELARIRAGERLREAQAAEKSAASEAAAAKKARAGAAREAAAPPPASPSGKSGPGRGAQVASGVRAAGVAVELANDFGIPGIPRIHDIPVVGPLLSMYLKYRAFRAAAGRFVGRVPATAETRAAALAARTKDGIARAVDRSLGLIERNPVAVRSTVLATSLRANQALQRRAFDDGQPDAGKGASVSELAAVRMREVAAAATNPQLISDLVRRETRGITDPDLITALENHLMAMYQHLNAVAPKGPPPNPYTKKAWAPSPAEALQFGRRLAVANDPTVAIDALHAQTLTPDMAETMRAAYAKLFEVAQRRLIERAKDLKNPVAYRQLAQNSMLFDVPLHPAAHPENAAVLSLAHAPTPAAPSATAPANPPTPSIAAGTNLTALYQTGADRRSAAR
jgi:hypothetical protein